MHPFKQLRLIGFLVLLVASAPLAAELKVGVIDLRRAVFTSEDAQEFTQQLQEQFTDDEEAIRKLQQEATAMRDRLETDGAMMNESERTSAGREFEAKVREFTQRRQQLDQTVNQQRAQFLQAAQPKIDAALEKILEERGLDLILPREAVVFAKPELDLTEDLKKRLNSATSD